MTTTSVGLAVDITDVTVRRGGTTVLERFDLSVPAGGAVGIIGANGAGKTTLLDVLSGLVSPDAGDVRLDGGDASTWSPQDRRLAGVRRVFQESRLYPQMTAAEAARVATRSRDDVLGPLGVIASPDTVYVSELSTGQRRLVDVAAAIAGHSRLLLLDEPSAGIAPHKRRRLIAMIRAWRERTGGTLVIVEHDRALLEELVDDIHELDGANVVSIANGAAKTGHPQGPDIEALLGALEATRRSVPALHPGGPSVWALARFGLREFGAGMLSVLTLGVLNRVMKVDLGISLLVVAPILAAYNLAAPVALWIGARSDRRPVGGLHRTPYIVAGTVLTGAMAVVAPFVAWRLDLSIGPVSILFGVGVFACMGIGMYGSGATYFALLAEVVSVRRERAVAVIYSMLMAGILAGVALAAYVLPTYDPRALLSLHGLVGVLIVVCTWWAVRGAEGRNAAVTAEPTIGFAVFVRSGQVKRFFAFMLGITFFAFLQQAILEPYGGDVFGLSVRATTSFNALQIAGVLVGMIAATRIFVPRVGRRRTIAAGSLLAAAGLGAIAASGLGTSRPLLYAGISALGFGLGLLNVGSLALMLDMSAGHAAGLAMGLWTVAHALADGAATAGGGVLQAIARQVFASDAAAYGSVFAFEAVGLVAVLGLLARIDPSRFREEFESNVTSEGGAR